MFSGEPTAVLKLPQYQPKDHPDFLTDFNEAFKRIDDWAANTQNRVRTLELQVQNLDNEIKQLRIDVGLTNVGKDGGNDNE